MSNTEKMMSINILCCSHTEGCPHPCRVMRCLLPCLSATPSCPGKANASNILHTQICVSGKAQRFKYASQKMRLCEVKQRPSPSCGVPIPLSEDRSYKTLCGRWVYNMAARVSCRANTRRSPHFCCEFLTPAGRHSLNNPRQLCSRARLRESRRLAC